MIVLSLFDGISCAHQALDRAGIPVELYMASEIDKYAIQVTMANYPDTVQLGSVTDIKAEDLPVNIGLIIGGSPCFPGDTLVMTNAGHKNIRDIAVGDEVLTHMGRWRKVTKIGSTPNQHVVSIRGYGNPGIHATPNHPFYSRRLRRIWNNHNRAYKRVFDAPQWLQAKELGVDKYLGMIQLPEGQPSSPRTPEFWRLMGRYAGDGWYQEIKRSERINSYQYKFIVCCGVQDIDEMKRVFDSAGYNYNTIKERTGYKFYIYSKEMVGFVKEMGKGASNKRVHPQLWRETQENQLAFLEGYLSADGCKKKNCMSATTTSKELAYGIQLLVHKLYGQPCSLYRVDPPSRHIIEGRIVNQKPYYEIRFKKDSAKNDHAFTDGVYSWVPIKDISSVDGVVERVYNISVEEDESYTANNLIVHNCQDLSVAKKGREGLSGARSSLFWEFVRLIKECKPKYFVLENVNSMPKDAKRTISEALWDIEPVMINASLVSAQNRKRLFWVGKRTDSGYERVYVPLPEDRGILLRDILESGEAIKGETKSLCIRANYKNEDGSQDYLQRRYDKRFSQMVAEKSCPIEASYYKAATSEAGVKYSLEKGKRQLVAEQIRTGDTDNASQCGWIEEKDENGERHDVYITQRGRGFNKGGDRARDGKAPTLSANSWEDNNHIVIDKSPTLHGFEQSTGSCNDPKIAGPIRIGEIDGKDYQQNRVYSPDGKSTSLNSGGGGMGANTGLYAIDESVIIPEATKQGFAIAEDGDSVDLSYPNSKTRRGRVSKKSLGLMTQAGAGVLQNYTIRKLTPVECERLQGVEDNYTSIVSNTQRYKCLGNAFNVDVVAHILTHLDNQELPAQVSLFEALGQ